MKLQETGLLAARNTESMSPFQRIRWEHLVRILPGVRLEDQRPENLCEVDWDFALALTVRTECTEEEVKEYFVALNRYYPLEEFRALYDHVMGHLPGRGPQGECLQMISGILFQICHPM